MPGSTDNEAANKAVIRRWFDEVWNQGHAELIDRMRDPGTVATGLGEGLQESRGPAPFRVFYNNVRGTLPDIHVTIEDMIAEGDKVCVRLSLEGTHTGNALAAATGRRVKFSAIVIARVVNGRIAEAWNNLDQLGLLKQIGALPAGGGPDLFLTQRV